MFNWVILFEKILLMVHQKNGSRAHIYIGHTHLLKPFAQKIFLKKIA